MLTVLAVLIPSIASVIAAGLSAFALVRAARIEHGVKTTVDQTRATGNGFAADVKDDLGEIKCHLRSLDQKIDQHILDHARGAFRESKQNDRRH